ncbi:MAG: hypothetical protein U9R49_10900 [Bacteroidota bacterium]|nr:hypothetical protein [Bacteroidota bacterium]
MKTNLRICTIILTTLFTCTLSAPGQEDRYTSAMLSAIETMEQASQSSEFVESANQFERIATAEKSRWIPYYYASYSLVVMSFDESDGGKKDQILDRAQELLDKAMELEPEESELYTLQAFLYPSRIMVDPMGRGMTYIEKMFTTLETAKSLNPDNPRIYFLEGVNKLNLPPSMGGGAEVAMPILEEALVKFKAFAKPDPLWPSWGEEATRAEVEKLQQIKTK